MQRFSTNCGPDTSGNLQRFILLHTTHIYLQQCFVCVKVFAVAISLSVSECLLQVRDAASLLALVEVVELGPVDVQVLLVFTR